MKNKFLSKTLLQTFIIILIPLLFFILSLITLKDYGISWDEPAHFFRGQAFLNFFLTGNTDYSNLKYNSKTSYYQEPSLTASYFFKVDGGHPPLNGIMAALTNYLFYQKLSIMGDIEAHHLFNILCATFLVLITIIFTTQYYGLFAGIIAGLSIASYPLLFSEGHFNIKDPAETAFFTATIWTFWNAIKSNNWRWMLASSIFFGVSLGTKFNILFLPFILIPWYSVYILNHSENPFRYLSHIPKKISLALLAYPIIVFIIFFGSWPYLWQDLYHNTLSVFVYYKDIGIGSGQTNYHILNGFNLFPITWIIITTPPIVLILGTIGFFTILINMIKRLNDSYFTGLLLLLWLAVPIIRVTMPHSSLYGGIRQIMEFIPALCILTGIGAVSLVQLSIKLFGNNQNSKLIFKVLLFIAFIPHILVMFKLHPNENVYFNSLIGGIKGAQQLDIPYWGNSFGNAYLQTANWLNQNAPIGSHVALIQGTATNIPKIYFRNDINFSNSFWSGIDRTGEYLVDLTHQGYRQAYPFVWDYLDTVLIPVYEVNVEGVTIAKIWKNDMAHSKPQFINEKKLEIKNVSVKSNILEISFKKQYSLAKLILEYTPSGECVKMESGLIETSLDGIKWFQEPEKIGDQQVVYYNSLEDRKITFIFSARKASYLRIIADSDKSCVLQNYSLKLTGFE